MANCVDPDQTLRYAESDLSIHCLLGLSVQTHRVNPGVGRYMYGSLIKSTPSENLNSLLRILDQQLCIFRKSSGFLDAK